MKDTEHGKLDQNLSSIMETTEVMKIGFRQDIKEGHVIYLAIDPQQFPDELLKAPLMTRFMAVFVRIDENEQPVPKGPKKKIQNYNVMRLAIACNEDRFHKFLQRRYNKQWNGALGEGNAQAADAVRAILNIDSRKDLASNPEALAGYDRLMGEYEMWKVGA